MPDLNVTLGASAVLDSASGPLTIQHFSSGNREGVLITAPKGLQKDPVLVRLQSSCLFSESFSAGDCDCAAQLRRSIELIAERGGVVVYVYDEGRGVGLERKLAAIRLQQDEGIDTATAYERLGLRPESRSFTLGLAALRLVVTPDRHIALLTNNPRKIEALKAAGFQNVSHELLICSPHPETAKYLAEKRRVLGHLIPEDVRQENG